MAESTSMILESDRPHGGVEQLEPLLKDLIARFNQGDLPRVLLRDVGLILIQQLAGPDEARILAAAWQELWRETVRLEQLPMWKQG